ncbi:cell division protein SepF [Actinospica durhamensis]|uniref:Cell division protein SepF n=1 Tax=Actinospica durhamensis TaxID=1508375 RepID=A0A941ENG4_9ACTN|nr:cell division protein SepF [Actinospica durhamensis]MBR7835640.1 cell division protein SepF [Actinospica durhamensis]
MPGFIKKTAVYLGLSEGDDPYAYDEEYEGGEDTELRPVAVSQHRDEEEPEEEYVPRFAPQAPRYGESPARPAEPAEQEVRPLFLAAPRRPSMPAGRVVAAEPARPTPVAVLAEPYERAAGAGGGEPYRITTLHPQRYDDARTIGEHFRDGTPVIMNLSEMGDADAKRLVDFAAGLVFGLRGSIERVTQKVFLLSPANVDVTAEDKARIAEGGFFNQS